MFELDRQPRLIHETSDPLMGKELTLKTFIVPRQVLSDAIAFVQKEFEPSFANRFIAPFGLRDPIRLRLFAGEPANHWRFSLEVDGLQNVREVRAISNVLVGRLEEAVTQCAQQP